MNLLQRLGRGLEAGGLAGVGVAVLFFMTDIVGLAPLRTVVELASPFFGQAVDPDSVSATLTALAATGAAVTLYSLLHFAAFGILGVVSTWVIPAASFWTTLVRGGLFGAVAFTGVFAAGRAVVGSPFLVETVGLVGLLLANAMAGTIMAAVLAVHAAGDEVRGVS
jgi:hypothetical protein